MMSKEERRVLFLKLNPLHQKSSYKYKRQYREPKIKGYSALHKWIQKELGKPDSCVECGRTGLSGKKIHWANKSHKYLRITEDWMRLCAPCHWRYDHLNHGK